MTGKSYACHNCRRGPGPHCAKCRRVDQDDIRIRHSPHSRAELQAAARPPASEPVTDLPADVENRLRIFMFDLFDLSPIQLLLLQHVRDGGTPGTFGRAFAAFVKSSVIYGDRSRRAQWERTCDEMGANVSRATAWAIWNGMLRRNPMLAVFRTWDEGHGGRQADAEREDEGRAVQAEFDFGADGDGTAKGTHRASGAKTPAGAHGAPAHAGVPESGADAPRGESGGNGAIPRGQGTVGKTAPTPIGRGNGRPSRPHD